MTIHDTEDWSSPGGQGPAQVIGDPILTFGTLLLGEDPSGNAQAIQVDGSGHVLTTGGYASLTGPGQSASPGELDQLGPFTVTSAHTDAVGFTFSGDDSSGFVVSTGGAGGVDVVDTGTGGITLTTDTTLSVNALTEMDFGDSVVIQNSGGTAILKIAPPVAGGVVAIEMTGNTSELDIDVQGGVFVGSAATTTTIELLATQQVLLSGGNSLGGVTVGKLTTDTVGFYGKPGVQRQARCVTLADVISVLANIGITA